MGKRTGDATINRADVLRMDANETLNLIINTTFTVARSIAHQNRQDQAA